MVTSKQNLSITVVAIICVFIAISGCTNTGPAVDTGGQMNNMVVATTPVPTATVAVAKTTAATSSPTTVVTTVATTVTQTTTVTKAGVSSQSSGYTYSEVDGPKPGGGVLYNLYVKNEGKTALKKVLDVTSIRRPDEHVSVVVELQPGEWKVYPISSGDQLSIGIKVVGEQ